MYKKVANQRNGPAMNNYASKLIGKAKDGDHINV